MDVKDFFRSQIPEGIAASHDISAYEKAMGALGLTPTKYLGGGMDAVAYQLENNQVLKFTEAPLEAAHGARPFDLPVLRRGKVTLNTGTNYAQDVFFHVQPLASPIDSAVKAQIEKEFTQSVAGAGYEWIDPGAHQLGMFEGKPALVDYPSAIESTMGVGGSLRPIPAEEIVPSLPTAGAPLSKTRWEVDRELAESVRGRPDIERIRTGIISDATRAEQTGMLMVQESYRGRLMTAVAHEHMQSRGFEVVDEPQHLGKMIKYPVRKMEGMVAAVPVPEAITSIETAAKIAAKETLSETHVNLESGVGKFLKKLMKLPFKGHSRIDPLAAAVQASEQRSFGATSYTGILAAGALALGASITIQGWRTLNDSAESGSKPADWEYRVPQTHQAPIAGPQEHFSIQRAQIQSADGTTDIHLDDAQMDQAGVDEAFTKHLKYGFAHSSR